MMFFKGRRCVKIKAMKLWNFSLEPKISLLFENNICIYMHFGHCLGLEMGNNHVEIKVLRIKPCM